MLETVAVTVFPVSVDSTSNHVNSLITCIILHLIDKAPFLDFLTDFLIDFGSMCANYKHSSFWCM